MADLTRTANQVAPTKPQDSEIHDFRCGVAVDHQIVYQAATGKLALAAAGAAGIAAKPFGIALGKRGIGDSVSVLKRGFCAGFDVSGKNCGDLIYLSNTAGEAADAAGTVSVVIGKVVAVPDDPSGPSKVAYFDFDAFWLA